jgi:quercetin 2,3-dioxygenase
MQTILHKAANRGHANHGWLNSYHSFSFAGYYDPQKMNFGALRVLNDDVVKGGFGFSKHPHENMEIVSIPLIGDLHHKDSTGRDEIIKQGDVQIMSAGSGIVHSETNANQHQDVHFLQIWILPKEKNIVPLYQQKSFPLQNRINRLQTVVAPNNEDAVTINQDAWFTLGNLEKGKTAEYSIQKAENGVYVFVIDGTLLVNGIALSPKDGLGITQTTILQIESTENTNFLLIDVPM